MRANIQIVKLIFWQSTDECNHLLETVFLLENIKEKLYAINFSNLCLQILSSIKTIVTKFRKGRINLL